MRRPLFLFVLTLATGGWSQSMQPATDATQTKQRFDGKWWSTTDSEERSGFINGVADCLTWTAHEKGFNATPEQLMPKITKFYKAHPELAGLSVVEVWQKITNQPSSVKPSSGGERWKNPHWYLDGYWWLDETQAQRLGFVEGYLWCMRTQVHAPTESYSKSASFYSEKIDAFVRANPKSNREAVAITLRRYRDKSSPAISHQQRPDHQGKT